MLHHGYILGNLNASLHNEILQGYIKMCEYHFAPTRFLGVTHNKPLKQIPQGAPALYKEMHDFYALKEQINNGGATGQFFYFGNQDTGYGVTPATPGYLQVPDDSHERYVLNSWTTQNRSHGIEHYF